MLALFKTPYKYQQCFIQLMPGLVIEDDLIFSQIGAAVAWGGLAP